MKLHKSYPIASFKAFNDEPGRFEAVVSVFGNVDLQGDRTMPGAFKKTIGDWRRKGDPIPVIWSHEWLNPDAHIGYAFPEDVMEIALTGPEGENGGLLVGGKIDVHKPFAAQVFDLLKERRVKEWSFAYDTIDEQRGDDGANELLAVDLIEVGPTLKGANSSTFTISAKSAIEASERELKEAYEAQRSLNHFIDLARDIQDPDIMRLLTKTYVGGPAPDSPRYHVEQVADVFACVENKTDKVADTHQNAEDAEEHVKQLQGGTFAPPVPEPKVAPPAPKVEVETAGQKFVVPADALELAEDAKLSGTVEERSATITVPDGEKLDDMSEASIRSHLINEHEHTAAELDGMSMERMNTMHRTMHGRSGTATGHTHEGMMSADGAEEKARKVGDLFWAFNESEMLAEQHKITGVFTDGTMTSEKTGLKWDGAAAMATCDTAGEFRQIAFERDNDSDPDTAAHWALPHHPRPGAEADPQGVSAALGALNGARGGAPSLKDSAGARAHLERHGGGGGEASTDADVSKTLTYTISPYTTTTNGTATVTVSTTATTMPVDELVESVKTALADGEKIGRTIGRGAATALKEALIAAVDEFVTNVNSRAEAEVDAGAASAGGESKSDEPPTAAEYLERLLNGTPSKEKE